MSALKIGGAVRRFMHPGTMKAAQGGGCKRLFREHMGQHVPTREIREQRLFPARLNRNSDCKSGVSETGIRGTAAFR